MKFGITGHRELDDDTTRLVKSSIKAILSEYSGPDLIGVSCIADGADSIFARSVLDAGGKLIVIVPAAEYRDGLPASHHDTYDGLLNQASEVVRLEHTESTAESHMDASMSMIAKVDILIAVWDGKPARGYGGTADVVDAAKECGVPVLVVWPDGAWR
jgi:hypothetical protein